MLLAAGRGPAFTRDDHGQRESVVNGQSYNVGFNNSDTTDVRVKDMRLYKEANPKPTCGERGESWLGDQTLTTNNAPLTQTSTTTHPHSEESDVYCCGMKR